MEHVTMKFSTHIASKGPEILNVTGKNEIYVTENVGKKEDPDSLKALSEQEKHVKFSQLLGKNQIYVNMSMFKYSLV